MRNRREIEDVVSTLLLKHSVTSPSVDVFELARLEGIPVIETSLPGELSGALIRSKGMSAIALNGSHHVNRQRFTVAHELGHYYLKHKGEEDHLDWKFTVLRRDEKSSEAVDADEMEANFFAASLLMPRNMLRSDISIRTGIRNESDLGTDDVFALARRYKVSDKALTYRLINLGLASPI